MTLNRAPNRLQRSRKASGKGPGKAQHAPRLDPGHEEGYQTTLS